MHDYAGKNKDEDDDHLAARIFKFGQLLKKLFNILCEKKSFEKTPLFCKHLEYYILCIKKQLDITPR